MTQFQVSKLETSDQIAFRPVYSEAKRKHGRDPHRSFDETSLFVAMFFQLCGYTKAILLHFLCCISQQIGVKSQEKRDLSDYVKSNPIHPIRSS